MAETVSPEPPPAGEARAGATDPSPRPPRRRRWAEHELGELLTRAWHDSEPAATNEAAAAETPAAEPVLDDTRPLPSGIAWEVDRLPSEAEGGIVGLLLNDPGGRGPDAGGIGLDASGDGPDARALGTGWGTTNGLDVPGSGLARLTEMLDHLPEEPPKRLTPDDVDVDAPSPAPPGVWFWGDDDIYPGKVPGVSEPRHAPRHHGVTKRRSPR
jgi:hypothetical protein